MKRNLLILALVVVDAAIIALSLLWMLAGYMAGGVVALLAAFAGVVAAARFWRDSPEAAPAEREWLVWDEELDAELSPTERRMLRNGCVPDPVDDHAAQMIRALSGRPAVLPEHHLLLAPRPGRHRKENR